MAASNCSRDCTKLVEGVQKQVAIVTAARAAAGHADLPVRGMLCFVDADWLFGGSFQIDGVDVLWPKAATLLTSAGQISPVAVDNIHRALASTFQVAERRLHPMNKSMTQAQRAWQAHVG